tara:strand:- start:8074 stop:9327 length:1254 start_codon:yes stop_codon:yes gene_type:complete
MRRDRIHIVGGGIIGLCAAWYLNSEGCEVTIIDENDISDGTSFGNAGMIVPSHFVPMAAPGVISQGLKWMLNSKSPFYIKPRMNADLIQWLWYFFRSSNSIHVTKSAPVLYRLNEESKWLYKSMQEQNGFNFGLDERGLLMLYKTTKQANEEEELAIKAHRMGVEAHILDSKALQELEPEMDYNVKGGIYFPGDAHLCPNLLMKQLCNQLRKSGVKFLCHSKIVDFEIKNETINSLILDDQTAFSVENVLLTSGSWTGLLLKKIGIKIHLQDGKGYSITSNEPEFCPRIPTILSEAKVAITPMDNHLRVGGTLELSGLSEKINKHRVKGILDSIPDYYNNLKINMDDHTKVWRGFRPCTPDGLPYIGKSDKLNNLYVGTGHGMMGLSLGAVTGKLLSEIITDQKPMLSVQPFRMGRF